MWLNFTLELLEQLHCGHIWLIICHKVWDLKQSYRKSWEGNFSLSYMTVCQQSFSGAFILFFGSEVSDVKLTSIILDIRL